MNQEFHEFQQVQRRRMLSAAPATERVFAEFAVSFCAAARIGAGFAGSLITGTLVTVGFERHWAKQGSQQEQAPQEESIGD